MPLLFLCGITLCAPTARPAQGLAQCAPIETGKLVSPAPESNGGFGASAAVWAETVVVGAPYEDSSGNSSGAAYVFEKSNGGPGKWGLAAKLVPLDNSANDVFGLSVAIHGDSVIVGAPGVDGVYPDSGAAYIFERNQGGLGAWGQVAKIATAAPGAHDFLGASVAIYADSAAAGAPGIIAVPIPGSVVIFERNLGGPNNWGEAIRVLASDGVPGDLFGRAVSLAGDQLAVGASSHATQGFNSGSAYVYRRDKGGLGIWGECKKLIPGDSSPLQHFGASCSLSGSRVVVGAPGDTGNGPSSGAAYVFDRDAGGSENWGETAKLIASDGASSDAFGRAVVLAGPMTLVGARGNDEFGAEAGAAYIFVSDLANPRTWTEAWKVVSSDIKRGDQFGSALGAFEGTVVLGSFLDDESAPDAGAAFIFESMIVQPPVAYCTAKFTSSGCLPEVLSMGSPSAGGHGAFTLIADRVETGSVGFLAYTTAGPLGLPFQGGFLCVSAPWTRSKPLVSTGSGACSAQLAVDFNAIIANGRNSNLTAGMNVFAQFWFRDSQDPTSGSGLTGGIEFQLCP